MRMPYVVGPPVKLPSDFFGRAEQTRQFFETLAGPQLQCVSVLGLRRAGKTSFLQYVAHPEVMATYLPDPQRYVMIYIDISACKSPADFYTRVYRRLLNALPRSISAAERSQIAADVYTLESLLYEFHGRRVVLLMDEFDHLRSAAFSDDFMTELRALAGVWNYELGYVTASYWDLSRIGNFVGLPPTSPFYNIFYPTPIYLSGLSPVELDGLVKIPAGRVGIAADDEDVAFVRHHAGTLPFFVQAMAAVWLTYKSQRIVPNTRDVTLRLVSEMGPFYEQWWRNFSDVERDVLITVAQERLVSRLPYLETEVADASQRLKNYGVIAASSDHLWTDSGLFNYWLHENAARAKRNHTTAPDVSARLRPGPTSIKRANASSSAATNLLRALSHGASQIVDRPEVNKGLGESEVRDRLLVVLESELTGSSGDVLLSTAGRADILARRDGTNIFVAECMDWKGQKALLQAVDHLLSYLTGDDTRAALVTLVRPRESKLVLEAIGRAMPQHAGYVGFDGRHADARLDYRLHLNGDPHRAVDLSVLLVAVPD